MGELAVTVLVRDGGGGVADQSIGHSSRPCVRVAAGSGHAPSRVPRHPRMARAFTLLEAVLALGMLSAVLVVCLQLRTQTIAARRDAAASAQHDRDVQAIVALITAGRLGQAVVDPETKVRSWIGEYDGRGYEVSAEPARVPNPMYGKTNEELEPEVLVWKYQVTFAGRATRFVWFR